jgi:hypothetical protein
MTSFATTETDITRFADGIQHFTQPIAPHDHNVGA